MPTGSSLLNGVGGEIRLDAPVEKIHTSNRKVTGVTTADGWHGDFDAVIRACAGTPRKHEAGTWITADMRSSYTDLHGLGFAGVLGEIGLPEGQQLTALLAFNVGVELGQIAVILCAYLAVGIWFRDKPWYHQRITIPGSLIISIIGLYWTYDRIVF